MGKRVAEDFVCTCPTIHKMPTTIVDVGAYKCAMCGEQFICAPVAELASYARKLKTQDLDVPANTRSQRDEHFALDDEDGYRG